MNKRERPVLNYRQDYEIHEPADEILAPLIREYVEKMIVKYAEPLGGNKNVLDVGCGGQPFRCSIEKLNLKYCGLDTRQNMQGTVDVIACIDDPLPQELLLSRFHLILCTEVLEHVADWDLAFKNIGQLLETGGHAIITCPFFWPLHEEPFDFWRPTVHAFKYFSEKYSLELVEEQQAGNELDVICVLLNILDVIPKSRVRIFRVIFKTIKILLRLLIKLLSQERGRVYSGVDGKVYLSTFLVMKKK